MKTKIKSILLLKVFFLILCVSCSKEELEIQEPEKTRTSQEVDESQLSSKSYGSYPVCTDRSGRVKVRVFYRNIQGQNNNVSVSVGAGYSLVGGGAAASRYGEGRGYANGLLMGSAPLFDGKTWRARSKDHGYADRHFLTVYAIGLKIDGVSESELTNNILILDSRNGPSNRPYGARKIPADYALIGGGA